MEEEKYQEIIEAFLRFSTGNVTVKEQDGEEIYTRWIKFWPIAERSMEVSDEVRGDAKVVDRLLAFSMHRVLFRKLLAFQNHTFDFVPGQAPLLDLDRLRFSPTQNSR